jgi:hypothetical protein
MNVERGVPGVGCQKAPSFVNKLTLFQTKTRVVLQKNNFKIKPKGRGFSRHGILSSKGLKSVGRRGSGNTPTLVFVDGLFNLNPILRKFFNRQIRHVRIFPDGANRIKDDGISLNNVFKEGL